MKRPYSCGLLCTILFLTTLVACGQNSSITSAGAQEIKIPIGDFYIHAPQTTFTAGVRYHFVISNQGTHNHNFLVMHHMQTGTMTMDQIYSDALASIVNISPGQTQVLDYTFDHTAPQGLLEFSSHYSGQWEAGMHQGIVVNAQPGSAVSPYNAMPQQARAHDLPNNVAGPCAPPVKVTLANGTFTPGSVSLKKGETLTIINTSNQHYTLTSSPHAGIRYTVVDPQETEYVSFPNAGTFTLSSMEQSAAVLQVSVSDTPATTCGIAIAIQTVNFKADYTQPKNGQYFFTPKEVSIKKGQTVTLANLSDQDLTLVSLPNANLGNAQIDKNESQLLTFAQSGVYTITSKQFPDVAFRITVEDVNWE